MNNSILVITSTHGGKHISMLIMGYMLVMEWCSTLQGEEGKKLEQEQCWTVSFAVHHPPMAPTLHAQNVVTKTRLMVSFLPVWIVFSLVIIFTSLIRRLSCIFSSQSPRWNLHPCSF
uniref:Transmembrane protein n=1 Tax=Medicago truncatula TaxID=3880 RepID=B7FL01_MEDTR|nr:unknown [Medicago truncatula]